MSSTSQNRTKKRGRGRPALSDNVAVEVVRHDRLDITKLAQAVEQYMRYMAELSGSTGFTQSSAAIASITPVLGNTNTNSIKTTGHSIERKR